MLLGFVVASRYPSLVHYSVRERDQEGWNMVLTGFLFREIPFEAQWRVDWRTEQKWQEKRKRKEKKQLKDHCCGPGNRALRGLSHWLENGSIFQEVVFIHSWVHESISGIQPETHHLCARLYLCSPLSSPLWKVFPSLCLVSQLSLDLS